MNHGGLEVVVSKEEHWNKSAKAYMSQHNLPSFWSCDFWMHFLKQITLISREEKMKDTKSNIVEN